MADTRTGRDSLQVYAALSGGMQAVHGLAVATETGDPGQHYQGS